uniref:Uncharacterized protein MANES_15G171100 n=1 Tax=Rhizophora mucronata TaxID=61149 RepID=A0A2P2JHW3_RHIMU
MWDPLYAQTFLGSCFSFCLQQRMFHVCVILLFVAHSAVMIMTKHWNFDLSGGLIIDLL